MREVRAAGYTRHVICRCAAGCVKCWNPVAEVNLIPIFVPLDRLQSARSDVKRLTIDASYEPLRVDSYENPYTHTIAPQTAPLIPSRSFCFTLTSTLKNGSFPGGVDRIKSDSATTPLLSTCVGQDPHCEHQYNGSI